MRLALAIAPTALLAVVAPRPAGACEPVDNLPHELDPQQADDRTPPAAPVVRDVIVDVDAGESACSTARCGGPTLMLVVAAADDRARADQLGYLVTVASGRAPAGLTLDAGPVRPPGQLIYLFDPDDRGWSMELSIRAVDANGNVGPATLVAIADPDAGAGCTAGRAPAPTWTVLVGLVTLVLGRRRRR